MESTAPLRQAFDLCVRKTRSNIKVPRVRSYSLNTYMNGNQPVDHAGDMPPLIINRKLSGIRFPPPVLAMVFLDESPVTIDDGHFRIVGDVNPFAPGPDWSNLPATWHSTGCNFAFADGHSEHNKFWIPTNRWRIATGGVIRFTAQTTLT